MSETNWQPIETAPTDGSKFLANDGREVFVCRWGDLFLSNEPFGWVNPSGPAGNRARPVAWMALPEITSP